MMLPWERDDEIAHPVTKSVQALARQLFERISSDDYPYGTRLPAERQLAQEFSLSRNTVRQALNLLESHGIITRRAGSGSFVSFRVRADGPASAAPSDRVADMARKHLEIAELTSPLELNVVRSIVEPEIARLAVINMSVRDIAHLKECLTALEAVRTNVDEFWEWDLRFHLAIARGTQNPLLIGVYELIDHVRRHAHWARNREKVLSPNRIKTYQAKHRSLYEAIEARDIEAAVEFSKLHMTEVQRDLMQDR